MEKTILESFRNNGGKFREVDKRAKEIQKIVENKDATMMEILGIYKTVFTCFDTERKETPLKLNEEKGGIIYINKNGFSIKDRNYQDNSSYIDTYALDSFIDTIKKLKAIKDQLLPYIKPKKQFIFLNFIDKIELLEKGEELNKKIEPIEIYEDDKEKYMIKVLKINPRNFNLDTGENNYHSSISVNLNSPSLRDKLVIEQVYDELITILQEFKDSEQSKMNNAVIMLDDLKSKFGKQLILKALKGNNSK